MKEKTLFKIAISCTIIGILTLLFLSEMIDVDFYTITEIRDIDNTQVRTDGIVKKVMQKENITIITIERLETLDIVYFDKLSVEEDEFIEVIGTTEDYEGKKEIIADSVRPKKVT